jgi:pantothenate kinase
LPNAAVVQADGFHYDNGLLDALGRRGRKGAPNTFDVRGLELTLQRIRAGEPDVVIPTFDRDLDLSRGSARMIARDVKHILVEGNYLTLGNGPWSALRQYCATDRTPQPWLPSQSRTQRCQLSVVRAAK